MATGLTDMEELLARVQNAKIIDYLREALTCYGTGAYRACIVMTFIAVFEDLRQKTKALVKVSAAVKEISADIESLADGQKPFENKLVERLASKELISELQAQRLNQIIYHRNKAAHPSGVHASAEEARFVYFEAIDKFLSQPVLSTTHAVDVILDRLQDKNYFPTGSMDDITTIINEELLTVHKTAYPYLIETLAGLISSADATTSMNSRWFIQGLSMLEKDEIRSLIYKKLIKAKASDLAYAGAITSTISADPKLLLSADGTTEARLKTLLVSAIQSTPTTISVRSARHPITLLSSLTGALTDAELMPAYEPVLKAIIENYWDNSGVLRAARKSKVAVDILLEFYVDKAGSFEFDFANRFAELLPDIDALFAEIGNDHLAFVLLASVNRAADNNAWTSQTLRNAKFNSTPTLREKAIRYAVEHEAEADKLLAEMGAINLATKFVEQYLTPPKPMPDDHGNGFKDDIPF